MVKEVKGIVIENAFCSIDGKERQSLPSQESFDLWTLDMDVFYWNMLRI